MSGLQKRQNNVTYIKIGKDGKIYRSADKELTEPFDEIEGTIAGLSFKTEEYNGSDLEKLQIVLKDEDDTNYALSLLVDSSYMSSFVSFAKNADLTQPITIVPVIRKETNKEGKEVERRSLLIKQNGEWLKSFFTKDGDHQLPKFEKKMVNKKPIWDKSDFITALQDIVENDFMPQINGGKSTLKKVEDIDEEDDQNLPF